MAYIRKHKTGYRAEVEKQGIRKSAVFPTKAEAQNWATSIEAEILAGSRSKFPNKTLAEALHRYSEKISARKRGRRSEGLRFTALERDFPALCGKIFHTIVPADIAAWRDARREKVSDSSVVREAATLRNVWTVARDEWGWCGDSPWAKVKLPPKGHARTRRTHPFEVRRLVRHMGYVTGKPPRTPQMEVAWVYMIAQHTAMRAQEVLGLKRSTVDLNKRVVTLHTHKTLEREGTRWVPVTKKAARLLSMLDAWAVQNRRDTYFTISSESLDVLFRKVRDRILIKGLHFHDSRADALTRLSKRVDILRLAKISGHRDIKQLMVYYRETAADVAAKL